MQAADSAGSDTGAGPETGRADTGCVSSHPRCPFCDWLAGGDATHTGAHAAALLDGFPLNPGHTLVVPRRHVADIYDLSSAERASLWHLVDVVAFEVRAQADVAGLNIGLNAGVAAGQTVGHAHVHVIPRYTADVVDPKGGVRWIIPQRADYWSTT